MPVAGEQSSHGARGQAVTAVISADSRCHAAPSWLDFACTADMCIVKRVDAGWSSSVARRAHNPEVTGSNPVPATTFPANPKVGGDFYVHTGTPADSSRNFTNFPRNPDESYHLD